ncbi:DNA translocase FtsK [Streptomyces sp. NPDC101221]|uniref:DNA translocase FtsK n=1 Tax=Streptomyces sp. NPDC101221 TaxID=3366132 RepID=UPI0038261230
MTASTETPAITEEQITEALTLIAAGNHAAVSAVQRWLRISFRDANAILDELEKRGAVGPAFGSRAGAVYVRRCEQCGRIGKRGFQTIGADEHTVTQCVARTACRKRWPKPARDDD